MAEVLIPIDRNQFERHVFEIIGLDDKAKMDFPEIHCDSGLDLLQCLFKSVLSLQQVVPEMLAGSLYSVLPTPLLDELLRLVVMVLKLFVQQSNIVSAVPIIVSFVDDFLPNARFEPYGCR